MKVDSVSCMMRVMARGDREENVMMNFIYESAVNVLKRERGSERQWKGGREELATGQENRIKYTWRERVFDCLPICLCLFVCLLTGRKLRCKRAKKRNINQREVRSAVKSYCCLPCYFRMNSVMHVVDRQGKRIRTKGQRGERGEEEGHSSKQWHPLIHFTMVQ